MAKRISYVPNRVIDTNGISDGASIYVYEAGGTTPVSIYSDEALLTPLTNPYTVASGAPVPVIYHNHSGNIRVRVVEDGGGVVSDDDPFERSIGDIELASGDSGKGAELVGVKGAGTGAATTNLGARSREQIYLSDYDTIANAVAAAVAAGKDYIHVNSASLTISGATDMQGVGIKGENTVIGDTANLSNAGPLVNCIVRGHRTDVDHRGNVVMGGRNPKIAYRKSSSVLSMITQRPIRGYVESEHWYDSYSSGPSDTGGNSQNWRQCVTRLISEAYLYKHAADDETASAWGASTNIVVSQSFPSGTASAVQMQYRSTSTLNAEIAWNVTATKLGQRGFVGIYSTGGSAGTVELSVNGTLQKTFSATLVGTDYIVPVEYELDLIGANEVRLKKTAGGSLNVIGAEFSTLRDFAGSTDVDSVAYGDWDEDYVGGNGASDYALYSTAQDKWFGSVHGGETSRTAAVFRVDGVTTTIPATTGDFVTGDHFELIQQTTIAVGTDSLNVDSVYYYDADATVQFDCYMTGTATVTTFYTAMNSATDRFGGVTFPTFSASLPTGKNTLGRYDTVTQINRSDPNYPLSTTLQFTLFPMGGDLGANMGANGPYISAQTSSQSKLYYGPILDSPTSITSIGFSTVRKFS